MAKKFVSPGVFTTEIDQSFLAQGIAGIGAVVIGRTQKGPAFTPTVVTDFQEFVERFGDVDPKLQVPYAAKNYLKNASVLTVVRVLGTKDGQSTVSNGWQQQVGAIADSAGKVLAEVHYNPAYAFSVTGSAADFVVKFVSGSTTIGTTASFSTASANYIGKVLNTDPTLVGTYAHYLYKNFAEFGGTGSAPYATASLSGATTGAFDQEYSGAQTPWIFSQLFGGSQSFNLFKLHTKSAGKAANTDVKVSVTNIRASTNPNVTKYGQFDVQVRVFGDTDNRPVVVESFPACDLDPTSPNYIARRIGDTYEVWDKVNRKFVSYGNFRSKSAYIRVELPENVDAPAEALPWGFDGYPENVTAAGATSLVDIPYVANNLDVAGNVVPTSFGVNFAKNVEDRLLALMKDAPAVKGAAFSLAYVSASASIGGQQSYVYQQGTGSVAPSTASSPGFSVAFYGGFDGWDLTKKDPTLLQDNAVATDMAVVSFKAAVDTIANPDQFDMNLLAVPGCIANRVTDYARQTVNDRADALFIMDITGSNVKDAINKLNDRGIDDNYTATYYPDLKISDSVSGRIVQVKPSAVVLGAFAFSDRVGQVFFAPAGLNRGGLNQFGVVDTVDRLTFQDRNDLYEARINPIASFPDEGIVVFGQKTLQAKPSALDRVNVRRLLIYAKKTIASAAKYLLFEPNNPNTWQRFMNTVNPILDKIRQDQGIERFRVVMDTTVNTPDVIDRNVMVGKIFLQPTRSAEFIDLQFVISASGVSFDE